MKRLIGTLFLCLITLNSFAQGSQTVQDPLDTLYDGGAEAYGTVLRQALVMPRSLIGSKKAGFVIFEITVKSTGEVAAKMMTKFNDDTEKSVVRAIQATVNGWIVHNEDYKIYQPVLFGLTIKDESYISKRLEGFPERFEFPILPVTTVTLSGITRSVRRGNASQQPASIAQPTITPSQSSPTLDIMTVEVERMKDRLMTNLEKGKLKKAYKAINEILPLTPFDKSLIQQRRRLEKELGKDEYRVYDILWLQALTEIKKIQ